jgi:methylated-DNA-[protein]-cysteine S-methyltransferase
MVRETVIPKTLRQACASVESMAQGKKEVSDFAKRVYASLMLVPKGKVTTYKDLAASVGCGSPRAVGQALRCNPFAPTVPCHRVVAASRNIGGFFGQTSGGEIDRKVRMLREEGVRFTNDNTVDAKSVVSRWL